MNTTETPILDAKEAVRLARGHFKEFYSDVALNGLLLEQIEMSEDGKVWEITFGFDTDRPTLTNSDIGIASIAAGRNIPRYVREYKTLRLDAKTGEFLSMSRG